MELQTIYDTRQSFYGKAKIETSKNDIEIIKDLISYSTRVASIIYNLESKKIKFIYNGYYSQTTSRHQKEFFLQNGLNDAEFKELKKKGEIIKDL